MLCQQNIALLKMVDTTMIDPIEQHTLIYSGEKFHTRTCLDFFWTTHLVNKTKKHWVTIALVSYSY